MQSDFALAANFYFARTAAAYQRVNDRIGPKIALDQRMMVNGRGTIFRIDSKSENLFQDEVRLMSPQLRQNVGFRLSY